MKATAKQKKVFDKVFDQEWRKLFVHLMERKNILLTELFPNKDLKSVSQTETAFFEDLAKDAIHYWIHSYQEENKTLLVRSLVRSEDEIMQQINEILKKKP